VFRQVERLEQTPYEIEPVHGRHPFMRQLVGSAFHL